MFDPGGSGCSPRIHGHHVPHQNFRQSQRPPAQASTATAVAESMRWKPSLEKLSDDDLRAKTEEFKDRLAKGETLDALLPEAFAVVREGSKRVMKMRHFDVQLLGGMSLHNGKISEMGTGEGKTLTATLPVYLNALTGKGVHVVTVNDYLANRDAQWMGKLYNFLGLTVGINLPNMPREEKQAAYRADITYGTNNEYGFDYLRDNMVYEAADRVQRGLNYAIVDEVDSILIDEARTPLIISGQAEDQTDLYMAINRIVPQLEQQEGEADPHTGEGITKAGDFTIDEKTHQVFLTERGHENAERILFEMGLIAEGASLYDPANITLMHHLYAALRANHLYHRDQHYVVQDGEMVIVDEFTGRLMSGRRWSEGLHQAVEAKEGVAIQPENQTMASITFQNYFRLYGKLAGMTGTADTEAYEFQEIYGLETVVMPPNRPSRRDDQLDRVYKTTTRKIRRRDPGHPRVLRARPAGAGGHHLDREFRNHCRAAGKRQAAAPGAQRQAARPRGRHRGAGRPRQDDHHCHQHGGPRHRHRAGWQHQQRSSRRSRRTSRSMPRKSSSRLMR